MKSLDKELRGIDTHPLLRRQLMRIMRQYCSGYDVTHMAVLPPLSGFLCREVPEIQQKHMKGLKLARMSKINSWNRGAIKALLTFSQAVWTFRSDILHNEATFTRNYALSNQTLIISSVNSISPSEI